MVFDPEDVESELFRRSVIEMIKDWSAYDEDCRHKAAQFTEQRVLGNILKGINALIKEK